MKKETLRYEEHDDSSLTKVEKITVTPEDGWVRIEKYHPAGQTFVKGRAIYTTYSTNHPKIVYLALILGGLVFGLVGFTIFSLLMLLTEDPEKRRNVQVFFAAGGLLSVFIFIKMCIQIRSNRQTHKEEKCAQAEKLQKVKKEPPTDV